MWTKDGPGSHLLVMVSPVITTVPRSFKGVPATTLSAVQVHVLPFTIAFSEPVFPALSKDRDVYTLPALS
jgi:hypothetical protein